MVLLRFKCQRERIVSSKKNQIFNNQCCVMAATGSLDINRCELCSLIKYAELCLLA